MEIDGCQYCSPKTGQFSKGTAVVPWPRVGEYELQAGKTLMMQLFQHRPTAGPTWATNSRPLVLMAS